MFRRLLGIAIICALAVSCASYFKRKDCEKTNWYQHGYDVAMSGRRLDTDDFVKQCQKVEANFSFTDLDTGFKAGMAKYCTDDNVYEVGKAGKPFSYDMCDGENLKKMKGRYTEGLRVFCTPSNGYRFGTSGGIYLNVCPKSTENDFLTEYRKGRKVYLTAAIAEKEKELARIDGEIRNLEGRRGILSAQQAHYSSQVEVRHENVYDPATGTYRQQTTTQPSQQGQMRANELNSEISGVNYQLQQARNKQKEISDELSKMRTEVVTL